MSKWEKSEGYIGYGTEFDYVYTRTIIKTRIVSLVEYIRIVKYNSDDDYWYPVSPSTGEVIFDNLTINPDNTGLYYNKAITFNGDFRNYNYGNKFIHRLLSFIFDKSRSVASFDKIIHSKYMKLDFVGSIVRKHYKKFTREERLNEIGI
jgi:hypothetical protein